MIRNIKNFSSLAALARIEFASLTSLYIGFASLMEMSSLRSRAIAGASLRSAWKWTRFARRCRWLANARWLVSLASQLHDFESTGG